MEEILNNFAKNLKDLMEYTSTSAYNIEKLTGIKHQTTYRYMTGENEPTITQALKLSDYFLINLEELILEDNDIIYIFEEKLIKQFKGSPNQAKQILKIRFPNYDYKNLLNDGEKKQ